MNTGPAPLSRPATASTKRGGGCAWYITVLIFAAGALGYAMYHFQESPQQLWKRLVSYIETSDKPEPSPTPAPTPEPTPTPTPEPSATSTPTPSATPTPEPTQTPIPAATPDPISYLIDHPEALPKQVTLLVATQFNLVVDGIPKGSIEGRPGTRLGVTGIEPGFLSVKLGTASKRVPIESTDLAERAVQAVEVHQNQITLLERLGAALNETSTPAASSILLQNGSSATDLSKTGSVFPASDPSNKGDWRLNNDVSDEFEGEKLDTRKWLIQGADGEFQSKWIGRAPSQFSTENVRVENGKLMIETRWEPDFKFSETPDKDGTKYENITTAAVISRKQFHYGYMEIKCKAAKASITSSFWMTGKDSELDVFEFNGAPSLPEKKNASSKLMTTIIGWATGTNVRMWRQTHDLGWEVAQKFHVYGCEWNEDFLNIYADGKMVGSVTREELGEKWVLKNPFYVWVDSETFSWQGLPTKTDLPAEFEIEYIRVWQKP